MSLHIAICHLPREAGGILTKPLKMGKYMQQDKIDNWQAFDNAQRIVVNASASYSGKYEDNMVYKF